MRVLQVIDIGWLAGGAEKSVDGLRRQLIEAGHEVRLLATDKNSAGKPVIADTLVPAIAGGPLTRIRRFAFYPQAYRQMREECRTFQPDVIHFHTIGELSPSVVFAARGVPHLVTVHGPEDFTLGLLPWHLPSSDYRGGSYRRSDLRAVGRARLLYFRSLQRPLYLMALRRCRRFVAPSVYMAQALEADFAASEILQIYNGLTLPSWHPLEPNHTLLYVGRLEAVKGVTHLLNAFSRVVEVIPDAILEIVGDGSARTALQEQVEVLGLSQCVNFRGWLSSEAVGQALISASIVAVPSVWPENLPTVVIEAMAYGRPVVGTNVGGLPELVESGVTGYLVPPEDSDSLAGRIVEMLSNPALMIAMGKRARTASNQFSETRFLDQINAVYEGLVHA